MANLFYQLVACLLAVRDSNFLLVSLLYCGFIARKQLILFMPLKILYKLKHIRLRFVYIDVNCVNLTVLCLVFVSEPRVVLSYFYWLS